MRAKLSNEKVKFWKSAELGNLELLHASYKTQQFGSHFHEGHVIGVIEEGALGFDYRGEKLVATAGQINIADPGEVHNGFSVSDTGWQYRMFYLKKGQLEKICNEIANRDFPMPFFKKGVIKDKIFAGQIKRLHKNLENEETSLLAQQTEFYNMLVQFVLRHAPQKPVIQNIGREKKPVTIVKDYINDNHKRNISLDQLSDISNLSRYYLLRVFTKQTGLTPHTYLNQVRALNAKKYLDAGTPIIDAAINTGFFDQSHLNRIFKKLYGITPGQYLKSSVT